MIIRLCSIGAGLLLSLSASAQTSLLQSEVNNEVIPHTTSGSLVSPSPCSPSVITKMPGDTLELKATVLILLEPKLKAFQDENSPEAEDYHTAMDDWSFYASEFSSWFNDHGIPVKSEQRQRFVFTLDNGQCRFLSLAQMDQSENASWGALLYRKGAPPLLLDITDSDMAEVERYLSGRSTNKTAE